MDLLSLTTRNRKELISFVSKTLNKESMLWVRNLINNLNRLIVETDDLELFNHVSSIYNYMLDFFLLYSSDLDAGSILLTFHICAVQLGLSDVHGSVEELQQFWESIDKDDWDKVTIEDLYSFDVRIDESILNYIRYGDELDISACGIVTLSRIWYYNKYVKEISDES